MTQNAIDSINNLPSVGGIIPGSETAKVYENAKDIFGIKER